MSSTERRMRTRMPEEIIQLQTPSDLLAAVTELAAKDGLAVAEFILSLLGDEVNEPSQT